VKGKGPYIEIKYFGDLIGRINDFRWISFKKPIILVPEGLSMVRTLLFGVGCNLLP